MQPPKTLKTSRNGYRHIQHFESCKLVAYPDPKSGGYPWTCGWGSTGADIGPGTVWTQEKADARLVEDVEYRERIVQKYVTVPLTQGMFDAMVDIVYNVGFGSKSKDGIIQLKNGQPSTLLRKLNAGDYDGAKAEYLRWVSPGSNVENGLRRRRKAGVTLWESQ